MVIKPKTIGIIASLSTDIRNAYKVVLEYVPHTTEQYEIVVRPRRIVKGVVKTSPDVDKELDEFIARINKLLDSIFDKDREAMLAQAEDIVAESKRYAAKQKAEEARKAEEAKKTPRVKKIDKSLITHEHYGDSEVFTPTTDATVAKALAVVGKVPTVQASDTIYVHKTCPLWKVLKAANEYKASIIMLDEGVALTKPVKDPVTKVTLANLAVIAAGDYTGTRCLNNTILLAAKQQLSKYIVRDAITFEQLLVTKNGKEITSDSLYEAEGGYYELSGKATNNDIKSAYQQLIKEKEDYLFYSVNLYQRYSIDQEDVIHPEYGVEYAKGVRNTISVLLPRMVYGLKNHRCVWLKHNKVKYAGSTFYSWAENNELAKVNQIEYEKYARIYIGKISNGETPAYTGNKPNYFFKPQSNLDKLKYKLQFYLDDKEIEYTMYKDQVTKKQAKKNLVQLILNKVKEEDQESFILNLIDSIDYNRFKLRVKDAVTRSPETYRIKSKNQYGLELYPAEKFNLIKCLKRAFDIDGGKDAILKEIKFLYQKGIISEIIGNTSAYESMYMLHMKGLTTPLYVMEFSGIANKMFSRAEEQIEDTQQAMLEDYIRKYDELIEAESSIIDEEELEDIHAEMDHIYYAIQYLEDHPLPGKYFIDGQYIMLYNDEDYVYTPEDIDEIRRNFAKVLITNVK